MKDYSREREVASNASTEAAGYVSPSLKLIKLILWL
jgi:hypothetical protein